LASAWASALAASPPPVASSTSGCLPGLTAGWNEAGAAAAAGLADAVPSVAGVAFAAVPPATAPGCTWTGCAGGVPEALVVEVSPPPHPCKVSARRAVAKMTLVRMARD
jgi:hypothetical protein